MSSCWSRDDTSTELSYAWYFRVSGKSSLFCIVLLGRRECEEEERRAREDIERLRLAEAAQLQQEEKQRQILQECVLCRCY